MSEAKPVNPEPIVLSEQEVADEEVRKKMERIDRLKQMSDLVSLLNDEFTDYQKNMETEEGRLPEKNNPLEKLFTQIANTIMLFDMVVTDNEWFNKLSKGEQEKITSLYDYLKSVLEELEKHNFKTRRGKKPEEKYHYDVEDDDEAQTQVTPEDEERNARVHALLEEMISIAQQKVNELGQPSENRVNERQELLQRLMQELRDAGDLTESLEHERKAVERPFHGLTEKILTLIEQGEILAFPGITPELFARMSDEQAQNPYATPFDVLMNRFREHGMKVVFGKNPQSGNIYVLPGDSDDIEADSIQLSLLDTSNIQDGQLREYVKLLQEMKRRKTSRYNT